MIEYILGLLFLGFIYLYYTRIYSIEKKSNIPGMSFWESLRYVRFGDPTGTVQWIRQNHFYRDFLGLWLGNIYLVVAVDADAAKLLLKDDRFKKLPLLSISPKMDYFAENIVSADGAEWRKQKALVHGGFTEKSISEYYPIFVQCVEKAISTLKPGVDVEITDYFSRMTVDVLGLTIFNHDFKRIEGTYSESFNAYKAIFDMFASFWALPMFLVPGINNIPFGPIKEFNDNVDKLRAFFQKMLDEHKGKNENSILSKLLVGADNPDILSDKELLGNLWIFFVAGHETTATALDWAVNCLREYPHIQDKVYEEIHNIIGENLPNEHDLQKLHYLDAFIQEVLRLHSPIPVLGTREAIEDVPYKNMVIPKGTRVGIYFHIVHTNPDQWEDPLTFNPDRFLPENRKGRNHFFHIPFSAGPRQCIGTSFSIVEQRLFLVRLLQKYKVVDPIHEKPWPQHKFLKMSGVNHVAVSFQRRN